MKPSRLTASTPHITKSVTTLTKKNLAILYSMACKLPPFDKVKMPSARSVDFKIINDKEYYGFFDPEHMRIEISSANASHFITIFSTLLHEMTHMALYVQHYKFYERHDKRFAKFRDTYATLYNLDPKAV